MHRPLAHPHSVGDHVVTFMADAERLGIITELDGRTYLRVRHSDGIETLYHFSDIDFFDSAPSSGWSTYDVREALQALGYGRSKAAKLAHRLKPFPEMQENLLIGVISTREEFESILYLLLLHVHREVTGDTSSSAVKAIF